MVPVRPFPAKQWMMITLSRLTKINYWWYLKEIDGSVDIYEKGCARLENDGPPNQILRPNILIRAIYLIMKFRIVVGAAWEVNDEIVEPMSFDNKIGNLFQ
jgi:hypothetical protein